MSDCPCLSMREAAANKADEVNGYGDCDYPCADAIRSLPPCGRCETHVMVPRDLAVTVDKQGVAFGKWCWFSHETITGLPADKIPTGIIGKKYWEWCQAMLAATTKGRT